MSRYDSNKHYRVFCETYGPSPWTCDHCGEPVYELGKGTGKTGGAIHHYNEDKRDNRPENIGIMHFGCHRTHHLIGHVKTPETCEKLSKSLIGHEVSNETRRKIGDANRGNTYCVGRVMSEETRRKISESVPNQRKAHCECGLITRPGSLVSHLRKTGHKEVLPSD